MSFVYIYIIIDDKIHECSSCFLFYFRLYLQNMKYNIFCERAIANRKPKLNAASGLDPKYVYYLGKHFNCTFLVITIFSHFLIATIINMVFL